MVAQSCTALVFSIDARTASLPRGHRSLSYLPTAAASSAGVCAFMARSWTRSSAASVMALLRPCPRSSGSLVSIAQGKASFPATGRKRKMKLTKSHGVGGISREGYQAVPTVPGLGGPVGQSVMPDHRALGDCKETFLEWRTKCFTAFVHCSKHILGTLQIGWPVRTPGLHEHPCPLCRIRRRAIVN